MFFLFSHKNGFDISCKLLLIVLGFNNTSTLVDHFVSFPRDRDRRDSRKDERDGMGRKRNRNESEETEEIGTFPIYPFLLQEWQALPKCKLISAGRSSEVRYTTPSPHLTTPDTNCYEAICIKCQLNPVFW